MEDLKLPSCPEASITKSKVEKLVKKAINKANEMDIRHSIEWENETSEHCEGNIWMQMTETGKEWWWMMMDLQILFGSAVLTQTRIQKAIYLYRGVL